MAWTSWLHGVLRELVLPPNVLILLFALCWRVRKRHWVLGTRLCWGVLALSIFLATEFGANCLVQPLEARTAALNPPAVSTSGAQAIVVLAAGRVEAAPEYGGAHVPDYIALARLRYAAHLQRLTRLPVLVSGGNRSADAQATSKAREMARALQQDFGVPVSWLDEDSENTEQNARFSAQLLKRAGVGHVLLVTDAMHMPRARLCFEQQGMQVTPAPTLFLTLRSVGLFSLLPGIEGMRRSYYASYEWLGLLWYRAHGL